MLFCDLCYILKFVLNVCLYNISNKPFWLDWQLLDLYILLLFVFCHSISISQFSMKVLFQATTKYFFSQIKINVNQCYFSFRINGSDKDEKASSSSFTKCVNLILTSKFTYCEVPHSVLLSAKPKIFQKYGKNSAFKIGWFSASCLLLFVSLKRQTQRDILSTFNLLPSSRATQKQDKLIIRRKNYCQYN